MNKDFVSITQSEQRAYAPHCADEKKGPKVNHQRLLDRIIEGLEREGRVPRLLLHSCCAPCSSYTLEYLSQWFEVTVMYYNPNISPASEYRHRVEEQRRLIGELPVRHPVRFVEGEYRPEEFYRAVQGLEDEPEGGRRCAVCFRLRLDEAARAARAGGYDYVTTTLTISPMKDAELLNTIGREVAAEHGVEWLPSDFKKRGGYQRSIELSREHGLYRQDFCGCVFSRREREAMRDSQHQKK